MKKSRELTYLEAKQLEPLLREATTHATYQDLTMAETASTCLKRRVTPVQVGHLRRLLGLRGLHQPTVRMTREDRHRLATLLEEDSRAVVVRTAKGTLRFFSWKASMALRDGINKRKPWLRKRQQKRSG